MQCTELQKQDLIVIQRAISTGIPRRRMRPNNSSDVCECDAQTGVVDDQTSHIQPSIYSLAYLPTQHPSLQLVGFASHWLHSLSAPDCQYVFYFPAMTLIMLMLCLIINTSHYSPLHISDSSTLPCSGGCEMPELKNLFITTHAKKTH